MSFWDRVLLLDIFGGLRMTGRHLFRKADTVEYPEQAREPSDRFRGMFRLDEERCIKCTLCAIECPINIIFIDWHNEKNPQGKNEKVLDRFDVDLKRCMFCGLCEEACPTNPKSIWLRTKTLRARDVRAQRGSLPRHPEAHEVGREREAVHGRRTGGAAVTAPFFFWFFAVLVVAGAVGVVAMRQPVHSALFLLLSFLGVAALFVTANAEFLAAVQILVYAGGIMVLFLFTIMLVNIRRTAGEPYVHRQAGVALLVAFLLLAVVGGAIVGSSRSTGLTDAGRPADPARLSTTTLTRTVTETVDGKRVKTSVTEEVAGNSQAVAWGLYRDYLLPFEVASVFLLVAMIGAVVLGKRTMERVD